MKKKFWIIAGIVVVVLGIGFWLAMKSPTTMGIPTAPKPDANIKGSQTLERSYSHMTGSPSAKVTLVEFGDYECPVCGEASQPLNDIISKYKNNPNFNFVFRNFPLDSIHPYAEIAAEAAEAAGAQGKYFQMHDALYTNQDEWTGSTDPVTDFVKYAQQIGLNMTQFKSDINSYKYQNNVAQDLADGNAYGIDATPTFFLNGQKIVGVGSLNTFDSQIQALLNNVK